MEKLRLFIAVVISLFACQASLSAYGQPPSDTVWAKEATKTYRQKTYRNLVHNSIQKKLSSPLDEAHEEDWMDAMQAMLFLSYKSDWTTQQILASADLINKRSISCRHAIFEYLFSLQIPGFSKQAIRLYQDSEKAENMALALRYLQEVDMRDPRAEEFQKMTHDIQDKFPADPITAEILEELKNEKTQSRLPINEILQPGYLAGQVLLLCLFREDRNLAGICLVRDTAGQWMKDSSGQVSAIPMLGRSLSNLPGYFKNGNTPQGLFRMDGFGKSTSGFIGPTENIQLTMPFEYKAGHFFRDSSVCDTCWSEESYASLLPEGFKKYFPAFQAYRAGQLGRREIIIHGSTVDPAWYRQPSFNTLTPTNGCLTASEEWDPETGTRISSDMQKLADLVKKAGGPQGYVWVLETGSEKVPVSLSDVQSAFEKAGFR